MLTNNEREKLHFWLILLQELKQNQISSNIYEDFSFYANVISKGAKN